jgi:ferric-dicitrate binding protein FerR (iron transport regulator)
MNWITELLFNAGSGGLFGMIGSLTTSWMRMKEKKVDNEHALNLLDKQAASAEALAAWQAFAASQTASAADMTEKVSAWAANVRAVTRPALTVFLVLGAFVGALWIDDASMRANAIQSFQMLAGTAVAWWFGSRMTQQIQGKK